MRAVVQRVSEASVTVDGAVRGAVEQGLLVYLGVDRDDGEADVAYMVDKVRHLRVFPDEAYRMNLDVAQVNGKALVVSAFTVQGDARRGRRPSFESAADAGRGLVVYEMFCDSLSRQGVPVERGEFGAMMDVRSVNAGPVCILLESRRAF
ncbi:MAG: D-tyrosyl-tRNA(Tyr) deacylase [Phycisphaerales bacterium]|nr:MAG: D-tyrosyl-tRNA(Tyr) deacylase [Phycisphaerales bacterium]